MRHSKKTYYVVCDVARTTGKNLLKMYYVVRFSAISYVARTMSYKKRTMSYTTSYTISHVRLARTCILTYDIVRRTYDIVYDIVYDICMNRSSLGRIITLHCLYLTCSESTPVSSRQWQPEDCARNSDDERYYGSFKTAETAPSKRFTTSYVWHTISYVDMRHRT